MKAEEFWKKYINKGILEVSDDACKFFSEEHFNKYYGTAIW